MDQQAGQGRPPRRAGLRPLPTPTDVELTVQDAPPLIEVIDELPEPRIAELDALLREVDNLRCTMRRDLTLAATAAEAGADELAGWLLLGEGGEVRAFEQRALSHLSALQAADEAAEAVAPALIPAPRRVRRMMPAAPLVAAAAAVIGFLTGGIPGTGGTPVTSPKTTNAAQSYAQLTALAANGASASSISAAAQQFHSDLAPLVATGSTDPAATQRAIDLLQSERIVIAGEADSPALQAVLAQADLLVRKLRAKLPHTPVVVPAAPDAHNGSHASPAPKSSTSPKPSPSASPKPSPKPSPSASPRASSKSSPSSSPSGAPLPGAPVPH